MIDYGTKNKYEGKVRPLVGAAYGGTLAQREAQANTVSPEYRNQELMEIEPGLEAALEELAGEREKQLDQAGISVTECWGPRQTTSPEAGGPGDGEDDVYLAGKAGV